MRPAMRPRRASFGSTAWLARTAVVLPCVLLPPACPAPARPATLCALSEPRRLCLLPFERACCAGTSAWSARARVLSPCCVGEWAPARSQADCPWVQDDCARLALRRRSRGPTALIPTLGLDTERYRLYAVPSK